jgi:hypothetical protein
LYELLNLVLCRFIVIYYSPAGNIYLNALSLPPQDCIKFTIINTIKEEKISIFSALTANTFKYYFLVYYRKLFVDFFMDSYVVILLVVKIYYAITSNTYEMMMDINVRIISFWLSIPLNYVCNPNFRECQERSIDRI